MPGVSAVADAASNTCWQTGAENILQRTSSIHSCVTHFSQKFRWILNCLYSVSDQPRLENDTDERQQVQFLSFTVDQCWEGLLFNRGDSKPHLSAQNRGIVHPDGDGRRQHQHLLNAAVTASLCSAERGQPASSEQAGDYQPSLRGERLLKPLRPSTCRSETELYHQGH